MYLVKKRNGRGEEKISSAKITARLENLCDMEYVMSDRKNMNSSDDKMLINNVNTANTSNYANNVNTANNSNYANYSQHNKIYIAVQDPLDSSIYEACSQLSIEVIKNIYSGITTQEIDVLSAKIAESKKTVHPDYSRLAGRICISNLHKVTPKTFSDSIGQIQRKLNVISSDIYNFIMKNADALDSMIMHENDYQYDYFGFKTLEGSYLMCETLYNNTGQIAHENILERPQYMLMRTAIIVNYPNIDEKVNKMWILDGNINDVIDNHGFNKELLDRINNTYINLSTMKYTHATPTLYNACFKMNQLLSCFLLTVGDSTEGIMKVLNDTAQMARAAGGIGFSYSDVRARNSVIKSNNGRSTGIISQLRLFNDNMICWNQSSKRKGSLAVYLEPHHADIQEFLQLLLPVGSENMRTRDLFTALWISDLFIERLERGISAAWKYRNKEIDENTYKNETNWYLFSEDTAPGLSAVYGDEYKTLYAEYVAKKLYRDIVDINILFKLIVDSQRESGMPYICFKDHANKKSNQSNIGTIKCSNLCSEIYEVSTTTSYACCTLASINLRKYINMPAVLKMQSESKYRILESPDDMAKYNMIMMTKLYNFEELHKVAQTVLHYLDRVIDINTYPVQECEKDSFNNRPVGIGIQGLADVFAIMRIPFTSKLARWLSTAIAETIYHGALTESNKLAETLGKYAKFEGSPASYGKLQFDLAMEHAPDVNYYRPAQPSGIWDWSVLRHKIIKTGLRNSLVCAYMPTASTSQIMGNMEMHEPFTKNIYSRKVSVGTFVITNKYMINHFIELGIWNDDIRGEIVTNRGSVASLSIAPELKEIYKTVWEISQKHLMLMAADRQSFIDQGQSFNIYLETVNESKIYTMIIHAHKLGLKTAIYYVRSAPASNAIMVQTETSSIKKVEAPNKPGSNVKDVSSVSSVQNTHNTHNTHNVQNTHNANNTHNAHNVNTEVNTEANTSNMSAMEILAQFRRENPEVDDYSEPCLSCGS